MKVWSTMKSNFSLGGTSISPNFDHQRPHPLPRTQFMRSVLRQFFPGTMNVEREEIWKYLILSDLVGCLRLTTLLHQLLWAKAPVCYGAKSAVWTWTSSYIFLYIPFYPSQTKRPVWGLCSKSVVGFKQPIRAWKHIRGVSFYNCHRVMW